MVAHPCADIFEGELEPFDLTWRGRLLGLTGEGVTTTSDKYESYSLCIQLHATAGA